MVLQCKSFEDSKGLTMYCPKGLTMYCPKDSKGLTMLIFQGY